MAPDWSGLVLHLLVDISTHVSSVEDFMAFRGVCSSWRAASKLGSRRSRAAAGAPLLMLAEKDDSNEREFYSLSKRKVCMRLPLPQAKGKRCMAVRFGWLLTLAYWGKTNLLNPFSRVQINLPDYRGFLDYDPDEVNFWFVDSALLSANPSDDSSNFTLFVVLNGVLGFWRPGDKNWTRISNPSAAWIDNICYCNQKLYIVNGKGGIMVWHPSIVDNNFKEILTVDYDIVAQHDLILVESSSCAGELLLIVRHFDFVGEDRQKHETTLFKVVRIDVEKREWKEIDGLENEAVFVGRNAAISVPADVIKPKRIYFTDQLYEVCYDEVYWNGDMGVFDLEHGSIDRFGIESLCWISPPIWIDSSIVFSMTDLS